jgi:hypothetical protein
METIRGKTSLGMTAAELQQQVAGYKQISLDLGTGDGRFVHHMAEKHPEWFFIGVDACRENLYVNSRRKRANVLFIIANAQALPVELNGLVSHITINFPWGSLLEGLLEYHNTMLRRLKLLARPSARMEIHLNGEAFSTVGQTLKSGSEQIQCALDAEGWKLKSQAWIDAHLLRSYPTTWAKRLAFGRDPRAVRLSLQRE